MYVIWCVTFTLLGIYAMIKDMSLKNQPCGQSTHMWKYTVFNTIFSFFTTATFFLFPGGGEGARARAMVVAIFHGAFATWGGLMWMEISPSCRAVFEGQYETVWAYQHISVFHNLVFCILMTLHEIFLGSKIRADYTLMSEIHPHPSTYNGQGLNPGANPPAPDQMPGMMPQGGSTQADISEMAPENMKDYDDILKSPAGPKNPPVHLPQGSP